jgi:hypothetical protein
MGARWYSHFRTCFRRDDLRAGVICLEHCSAVSWLGRIPSEEGGAARLDPHFLPGVVACAACLR